LSLRLVRIDDRLIHGQVVAVWLRTLGAARIVIVDDATARDEFLRDVLTLAAPQAVPAEVCSLATGGGAPGRRRLHKTISVSSDELREFRDLERLGTRVEIQIVADDRPIPFQSLDPGG
jgi:mannose/fructose/N-acetylgalactosamine-specific phosphotransferase system component IIB